ncbi:MAG: penicillin-binding protein [Desulfobacteraceae bacterium IS3]|nr:MAG: penicillin-binding protein [Desulfobacteraceae bacterium IS3]
MRKNRRLNEKDSPEPQKSFARKILRYFLWTTLFMVLCCTAAGFFVWSFYSRISKDLPQISSLKDYRPPLITTVYSDDNRKVAEFYKERRILCQMSQIPKTLIKAFVAAEDSRFFEHPGVDYRSIIRAFFKNLEAGEVVQGGSTITQQVTKSFLLTPERSYERKLKEAILAYRIDKAFSKDEILFLYLNQIYLGHGAYGVGAAAENYFRKSVTDLNLAECAMLAGLPKAPGRDSPFLHPERAKERQLYVLKRMVEEGYISQEESAKAAAVTSDIKPVKNWFIEAAPFYTEHVRRYIEKVFGPKLLYEGGLKIYTPVNIEMQKTAQTEVEKGLKELDKRHGYRGPAKHLAASEIESFSQKLQAELERGDKPEHGLYEGKVTEGVVIGTGHDEEALTVRIGKERATVGDADMKWARNTRHPPQVGDVVIVKLREKKQAAWRATLDQMPEVQGALLCVESGTGLVKAMIGGRDFRETQFNRAIQAKRQPGSAFKPIVYGAAIDKGYTPASVIIDNAIVYDGGLEKWKPQNYDRKFYGPTLLRKALAKSRNLATIQVMRDIGVKHVIKYARKLGITSELYPDLSLALGSSAVSLLELVTAYSVFANLGELIQPVFITKIIDRDGKEIQEMSFEKQRAIAKNSAYIMTSLLEGVVKHGTGYRIKELNRPAAGKTGTTNEQHDAWFVGYTPDYITGVWVGFDQERSLGRDETGAKAASPIWLGFMQEVLKDKPIQAFDVPEGVVFSNIDAETGLLAVPDTRSTIFECFKEGTVPRRYSSRPSSVSEPEQFFKSNM